MVEQCYTCEKTHDATCSRCGNYFCREHGHLEEEICDDCLELESEEELI